MAASIKYVAIGLIACKLPFITVTLDSSKLMDGSDAVNIRSIVASLVVLPLVTPDVVEVIVIVGGVVSYVQINVFEAVLLFPAVSVNASSFTIMVHTPLFAGVNVALYSIDVTCLPKVVSASDTYCGET